MHHRSHSARTLIRNDDGSKSRHQRPQSAVVGGKSKSGKCSGTVIYDPFESMRSELGRQSKWFESGTMSGGTTKSRYTELQRAALSHRLSRIEMEMDRYSTLYQPTAGEREGDGDGDIDRSESEGKKERESQRKRANVVIPHLFKLESVSNCNPNFKSKSMASSRCLSTSASSCSLSLHSRLQNSASSHSLGLLSARYLVVESEKKKNWDSNWDSISSSDPLTATPRRPHHEDHHRDRSLSTTKSKKTMELQFERIDEMLSSHRPNTHRHHHRHRHRVGVGSKPKDKSKSTKTLSVDSRCTATLNENGNPMTKSNEMKNALDHKLDHLRSDSSHRQQFKDSVDRIRRHRHRRMVNTNYLTSNRLSAAIHSKDCALKTAQKLNSKWRCNRERIRSQHLRIQQEVDRKQNANRKQWERDRMELRECLKQKKDSNSNSLRLQIKGSKSRRANRREQNEKEYRVRFWRTMLCTVQRMEAMLSLMDRMDQIESLRRRERESGKVIIRFYRKYVVSKRQYNTKEMVKALQRSLRSYALKHRVQRIHESSEHILLFLKQLDKTQGLLAWTNTVDINGRAAAIQRIWRRHKLINQCQKQLIQRQLVRNLNSNLNLQHHHLEVVWNAVLQIHADKLKAHHLALRQWIRKREIVSAMKSEDKLQSEQTMVRNQQIIGFKPSKPNKPRLRPLLNDKELNKWVPRILSMINNEE